MQSTRRRSTITWPSCTHQCGKQGGPGLGKTSVSSLSGGLLQPPDRASETASTFGPPRSTPALFLSHRLVPIAHEGRRWTYRNAKAVPWPKLSDGLAALDSTAQTDGMLVTDLAMPRNVLVQNGTGIILDFDLHRAWGRDLFAPALAWLGCAGCSSSQQGQLTQPHWCTQINFCSQVRLSPYLNLYGNADTARSMLTLNRASLQTIRSGHGQAARGGKVRPARGANARVQTHRTSLPK